MSTGTSSLLADKSSDSTLTAYRGLCTTAWTWHTSCSQNFTFIWVESMQNTEPTDQQWTKLWFCPATWIQVIFVCDNAHKCWLNKQARYQFLVQHLFCAADGYSAGEESIQKYHHCCHNSSPPNMILGQFNLIHNLFPPPSRSILILSFQVGSLLTY